MKTKTTMETHYTLTSAEVRKLIADHIKSTKGAIITENDIWFKVERGIDTARFTEATGRTYVVVEY